jgi:hypothetical protein
MRQDFRSDIKWYLALDWGRWYHNRLLGFSKSLRKTDVLMSAMFKVAKGQRIKTKSLINVIGYPELIEGTIDNGGLLYSLHRAMNVEVNQHWMMLCSHYGILVDPIGTNLRLYFRVNSAFKWRKTFGNGGFG